MGGVYFQGEYNYGMPEMHEPVGPYENLFPNDDSQPNFKRDVAGANKAHFDRKKNIAKSKRDTLEAIRKEKERIDRSYGNPN